MNQPSISVLMIDDHEIVLHGLKRIVERIPCVGRIVASLSGEEAIRQIECRPFDLCVTDFGMPDCPGFELIERIQTLSAATRIVVYTPNEELWTVRRLIRSGVQGIVAKASPVEELRLALVGALAGERHLDGRLQRLCREGEEIPDLSRREREVLQAIVRGNSTREIAELLCLSDNTIETHRRNLFAKLDVHNVAQLVVQSIRLGLVSIT